MDEVRRQVEAETTEVIMCLQEELLLLQQQLEASNNNELLTKQNLNELQQERKQLNDKLHEVLKENESFSSIIMKKEKEIEMLTNDWDRLAADIESYLLDGNAALVEASDQVAFMSKPFSRRKWVEDRIQKMCQGISERDELLQELQNRLKEADDIRCDLDLKLKSLRGAMQAVHEVHQQEKSDQEKEIYLLRSELSEHGSVNNQQVKQIHTIELLLDESIETFVQKEVLEQNYVSLQRGMVEEICQLNTQLDKSKRYLAHLLSQAQDKDHAIEKLKNEECTVLLNLMYDVLKAKGIIHELGVGLNELRSSITVHPEVTVSQNSDLNFEDRVDLKTLEGFQPADQQNSEVLCQFCKEMEFTVERLQIMQSEMAAILQEKDNMKEFYCQNQRSMKDLSAEVVRLNSDIIEKEQCYEARLKELEIKMQDKDHASAVSVISWNKEKEALEHEVWEVKLLAAQKSFEASILIDKFEEASENAKLEAEKYKEKEDLFIVKNDDMLNKINSLKMLLDMKEQNYNLMEKKFQASLFEANGLALELEEDIRLLQNLLSEKLDLISSDVNWMKTKVQQSAELTRTWLAENWLEIIGKDCAISVFHLCHMSILLERIMGLNAENGFLQRGLCNSNSLITELREHNDKAKNELEMCTVLKGKLLLDINHSFSRIATKKEHEVTELELEIRFF
ncbi:hypothetical protein PR202_gb24091 [Eleusine coracana subsp. coracana]|uniref:Uncharacterized protein n=1 Tax=Eleusine coracana subsp. coracana TaxID=191504 RepID=A0AAV5FHV2_ELECO|nr:hypothetical protein PR202_gb24091 [Eleusine coracana subsp. coracana]